MSPPDDSNLESPSQEFINLAIEASPNGVVISNRQGIIISVNSAIENMFGYHRKELVHQSIERLIPERFRSSHPQLRKKYTDNPNKRAIGEGRELFALHKSGYEFPVEIGLNSVTSKNELFVIASIIEISDRKRAEDMMRLAVEASPNGMLLTDANGNIVMVNSMIEDIFGYTRDELMGQSVTLLVPERFKEFHPVLRQHYYNYPKARAMGHGRDLYGAHKNGNEIPLEIGLNPIETTQGLMILASVVDITERKQQESAILDALKEKEILLSEVHHRVKNNLQIIDSLIGLQSRQVTDPKAVEVLMECQNRVKTMAVIHRTLYESKNFSRVDFKSVTKVLLECLLRTYRNDEQAIELRLEVNDVHLPINTSIPLGLIINELCSNVLKHAYPADESGALLVKIAQVNKATYRLTVEDNGIGIDDSIDIASSQSMGFVLVTVLTEQINGHLNVKRKHPTRFDIEFSI